MTANRQPLCRGFATFRFTPEGSMETLYAVLADETIDVVRRIACGYYPSLCKHFGPARQFAGV